MVQRNSAEAATVELEQRAESRQEKMSGGAAAERRGLGNRALHEFLNGGAFSERLAANAVYEWQSHYMNCARLHRFIDTIVPLLHRSEGKEKVFVKTGHAVALCNSAISIYRGGEAPQPKLYSFSRIRGLLDNDFNSYGIQSFNEEFETKYGYDYAELLSGLEAAIMEEGRKTEAFFNAESVAIRERLAECVASSSHLKDQILSTWCNSVGRAVQEAAEEETAHEERAQLDATSAWRQSRRIRLQAMRVRAAFIDLWRTIKLLRHFAEANKGGFVRVISVARAYGMPDIFRSTEETLAAFTFWSPSEQLQRLSESVLSAFAEAFCEDNKDLARSELLFKHAHRSSSEASAVQGHWHSTILGMVRTGLVAGMVCVLIGWIIWDEIVYDVLTQDSEECLEAFGFDGDSTEHQQIIDRAREVHEPMYQCFLELTLWALLWGLLLIVWRKLGISHFAIFGFDPNKCKDQHNIFANVFVMLCIWCASFLLYEKVLNCELVELTDSTVHGWNVFALYLFGVGTFFIWTRWAVIRLVWNAVKSPFTVVGVLGIDSYVGDVLTSIISPINRFAYTTCFIISGDFTRKLGDQHGACYDYFYEGDAEWLTYVILLFPGTLRLAQNLRLMVTTGKRFPHLVNATKYGVGLLVTLAGLVGREENFDSPWLALLYFNTVYSFLWDITMDWALIRSPNTLLCLPYGWPLGLRQHRLFSSSWVYFAAASADLGLRFFYSYTLVPDASQLYPMVYTSFNRIAGGLELCRRFIWSIFKLENVQLHAFNESGYQLPRGEVVARTDVNKAEEAEKRQKVLAQQRVLIGVEVAAFFAVVVVLSVVVAGV